MAGFFDSVGAVRRLALSTLGVLHLGLLSCSDGSSTNMVTNILRDSAGVQIAENAMLAWSDVDAWVVDTIPSVRIGGEVEDSVPLVGVKRARLLADGRIVVALGGRGIKQLLMFDPLGDFERVVGRSGEGPGEFRRVTDMYVCAGDTVLVNESFRVSFFNAQGQFVRSTQVRQAEGGGRLWPRGISADCSTLLVTTRSKEAVRHGTIGTVHTTLIWSAFEEAGYDTVTTVALRKVFNRIVPGWDDLLVGVPWGQLASWTVGAAGVYVGVSERPEIRLVETNGRLARIIRWTEVASPVTGTDRRLFVERWRRSHSAYPPLRDALPPLSEYPEIPGGKPLFHTLLVDDEGNLWVRGYPDFVAGRPESYDFGEQLWEAGDAGDESETWSVFDEEGRLLGMVEIPAKHHVLAIERVYVVTVTTNEYDIEVVELYRLIKRMGADFQSCTSPRRDRMRGTQKLDVEQKTFLLMHIDDSIVLCSNGMHGLAARTRNPWVYAPVPSFSALPSHM